MTNKRIFRLLVVRKYEEKYDGKHSFWLCRCDCGEEIITRGDSLRNDSTKSCGCYAADLACERRKLKDPWDASLVSLIQIYKTGAANRGLIFNLNKELCHQIFKGNCHYCGIAPNRKHNHYFNSDGSKNNVGDKRGIKYIPRFSKEESDYIFNGIDRMDNNIGYLTDPGQCVSACYICNRAKNDMTTEQWYNWIEKINLFKRSSFEDFHSKLEEDVSISSIKLSSLKMLIGNYRRRHIKTGHTKESLDMNINQFHYLFSNNCFYCGEKPIRTANYFRNCRKKYANMANMKDGDYLYNGIDRINNEIGYEWKNCVTCCKTCNYAKSSMSYLEFEIWTNRLIEFQKYHK